MESYFINVEQASGPVRLFICLISIFLLLLSIIDRKTILPILPIPLIPTLIVIIYLLKKFLILDEIFFTDNPK